METIEGLREVDQKAILITQIGNVNWFIRMEGVKGENNI